MTSAPELNHIDGPHVCTAPADPRAGNLSGADGISGAPGGDKDAALPQRTEKVEERLEFAM